MYVGRSNDCEAIVDFTSGFETALSATDQLPASFNRIYPDFKLEYYMKRHWNGGLFTPLNAMRKKGFSDEKIVLELIKLEIEMWREYRSVLTADIK